MAFGCLRCVCENKNVGYTCIAVLFILGVVSIVQIFFVTSAVEDVFYTAVDDQVVMTQAKQDANTQEYQEWVNNHNDDAPLQLFEFWLYNVTNPYEVPLGTDPSFELIGPFTFRRLETRTGPDGQGEPVFSNSSTVEFAYVYDFQYMPERSTNVSLDAHVWTFSGSMMGLFATVNQASGGGPFIDCVDTAIQNFPGVAMFWHTTVRNFTDGLRDTYIEGDINRTCGNDWLWNMYRPSTLYSLIDRGQNGVVMHTGQNDISRLGELQMFRNYSVPVVNKEKTFQGYLWEDHEESVQGSRETRNFPPRNWITTDSRLKIWSVEKFRVTQYEFQKHVDFKGVPLMRFRLNDAELYACRYTYDESCTLAPTAAPSSSALPTVSPTVAPTSTPTEAPTAPTGAPTLSPTCVHILNASHTCKYYQFWADGVANLTNLRGSPAFLSKGRFLDAPFFINDTNRRFNLPEPDYERDDQYFDVDPKTGIVFRNYHSYQINFRVIDMPREYPTNFTNLSVYNKLVPFAYVRVEAIATHEQIEFYKSSLDAIDVVTQLSLYGGPVLAVLFFGVMFCICCQMNTAKQRREADKIALMDDKSNASSVYGRLVEDDTEGKEADGPLISMGERTTSFDQTAGYGATKKHKS